MHLIMTNIKNRDKDELLTSFVEVSSCFAE